MTSPHLTGDRRPRPTGSRRTAPRLFTMGCFTALVLLGAGAAEARAQDWARKMFKDVKHDFGVVARGAKSEFRFELTNIYEEDVHIKEVRSSCGCTTPAIEKQDLKTWEVGAIVAVFNTRSFLGKKQSTITVVIDRPFHAEVQLQVEGFIRSDVVFAPGLVDFGTLDPGVGGEREVLITYAGRTEWKLLDVRSANANFEVELDEVERVNGQVKYKMLVRLKGEQPAGYLREELTLVTDDASQQFIPLPVEGQVLSPLTASPSSLVLGSLAPGDKVIKQLVIRAKQPFEVQEVVCPHKGFAFDKPTGDKTIHLLPITFTAGNAPGRVSQTIVVRTSLGEVSCVVTASIRDTKVNSQVAN